MDAGAPGGGTTERVSAPDRASGRTFFGTSPAEYRRAVQLEWAAARLRASDEPIAAIALRAGFFDQSHLTRGFRRRYRVTPGQYRSRHSIG